MAVLRSNGGTGSGEKTEASQAVIRDHAVVVFWWARAFDGETSRVRERSENALLKGVWGEEGRMD